MITGGTGGANTKTGLNFETKVDLITLLTDIKGYTAVGSIVDGKLNRVAPKHLTLSLLLQ